MRVHREINALPAFNNGVLTIGTFDGVHRGHQQIIKRVNQLARNNGGESILLTFHPHPRLVIKPDDTSLKLINTLEEKIDLLEQYGLDNLIITPFSREFSSQPPEDYITKFLWEKIRPHTIVIGYDHRFGKNRAGDIELMREYGQQLGFQVEEIEKQLVDDLAVSSTKVRNALQAGNIEQATSFLGHGFSMEGIVVKGDKIGSDIGFPTANIFTDNPNKLIPDDGVYAVQVEVQGEQHDGMLYIGPRPTLPNSSHRIEVNIFNFNKDIYGDKIRLHFISRIRGDEKFESMDAMAQQLQRDKEETIRVLGKQ